MIHSRLADWVLACAVAPADREAAVGDLIEEHESACAGVRRFEPRVGTGDRLSDPRVG